jgi:glyoxylase-like metal-dependent hydrolase (beta-lactamase superfamily II)
VGERLTDGQVLDVAGGLEVVHTPGHSPGHVAYLHRSSGVLITGDSIFNVRGVRWPVKSFCTSFRLTQKTAHRLAELDYTTAAFTHGPHISDQPREAIRRFLARQEV